MLRSGSAVLFGTLYNQEKLTIVKNDRPIPEIEVSTKMKSYNRRFKMDYCKNVKKTNCLSVEKEIVLLVLYSLLF